MIRLFYDDKYLCVCLKPVGVLSEPETGRRRNMPDLLQKQTRAFRIDVIHRLDQPVGGVMVYSKNSRVTPGLYAQMAGHTVVKEYFAIVSGAPKTPKGEMCDWLLKDKVRCKSRVVPQGTKGAKDARLEYEVIRTREVEGRTESLVRLRLHTGRTHQIRVQFSSRGMPLIGDEKYGGIEAEGIALWSCHLVFRHPVSREMIDTFCPPEGNLWKPYQKDIETQKEHCL